ncbi:ABC transporter ATP-binding protein [Paracoccus pantotrophus]|uniref:ABC transporter ATP-binding protein n=1 Tax=Paracoccus pantotrophus TaxID=82367 RepID=A0A7H9BQR6_PARPN|nr:ABC transporter ATP-binding protein [Paracoccus pantotrophus]QLH13068.1 ABC transporter ATP-binding protein [Paracoccus pantotrophus]
MSYGAFQVLQSINMQIAPGEFVTLLGPSGSGKTTLLMAIAGFAQIDAGRIEFSGREISGLPAERRNIGIVFQNYALFPHMTIGENVAYPLKVRRWGKAERAIAVQEALARVQLGHLIDRNIAQLSGGQRQRVALARALVFNPSVLLMDEPLSALDKSLREDMQFEIKEIQKRLGITTISVTHDQREALSMADKIAIMRAGQVEQFSSAREVFDSPKNSFVAQFIGDTNLLRLKQANGRFYLGDLAVPGNGTGVASALVLRSDEIELSREKPQVGVFVPARINASAYQGTETVFHLGLDGQEQISIRCRTNEIGQFSEGDQVWVKSTRPDPIIVPIAE